MALDQSQEHSIKFFKQDSGAKGLYGQPEEKEVIELSKSEVLRSIDEFEREPVSLLQRNSNVRTIQIVQLQNRKSSSINSKLYAISLKRVQLSILSR